jgi:hypothetical protein
MGVDRGDETGKRSTMGLPSMLPGGKARSSPSCATNKNAFRTLPSACDKYHRQRQDEQLKQGACGKLWTLSWAEPVFWTRVGSAKCKRMSATSWKF